MIFNACTVTAITAAVKKLWSSDQACCNGFYKTGREYRAFVLLLGNLSELRMEAEIRIQIMGVNSNEISIGLQSNFLLLS